MWEDRRKIRVLGRRSSRVLGTNSGRRRAVVGRSVLLAQQDCWQSRIVGEAGEDFCWCKQVVLIDEDFCDGVTSTCRETKKTALFPPFLLHSSRSHIDFDQLEMRTRFSLKNTIEHAVPRRRFNRNSHPPTLPRKIIFPSAECRTTSFVDLFPPVVRPMYSEPVCPRVHPMVR